MRVRGRFLRTAALAILCITVLALVLAAQLTVTVTPTVTYPGGTITVSIQGGVNEEYCSVEIRDPTNVIVYVRGITLSNGAGEVTWSVPIAARTGNYTVHVACEVSGYANTTFTVIPPPIVVGGEVIKDFTPMIATLGVAAAAVLVAVSALIRRRQ